MMFYPRHGLNLSTLSCVATATLALGLNGGISYAAGSDNPKKIGYAVASDGDTVHTSTGECVHTSSWDPARTIPGCDGHKEQVAEQNPPAETEIAMVETEPTIYTLETEALFDFDKAVLRPEARQALDAIVSKIDSPASVSSVTVVGHTDRLGPTDYNLALSRQRAAAVSEYLRQHAGIDGDKFIVRGQGERQPVLSCDNVSSENALIKCLQPNRRVEIDIGVEQTAKRTGTRSPR